MVARACLLVLVATAAIAACTSPIATGRPSQETALIAVPTQPPAAAAGTPAPCPAALLRGVLLRDETTGLVVYQQTSFTWKVVWPHGYAAEDVARGRVLVDETGRRIAFEGDVVEVAGSGEYPSGWAACGPTRVVRDAALAAAASIVPVLTHAPRPAGAPPTCAAGAVAGTLVRADPPFGLGLVETNTGTWMIAWPYGFTARDEGTTRVLVDAEGRTLAREGDRVRVGGAGSTQQVWSECGGIDVLGRPPASS